jgi:predicted phosphate transport protein (TIGR00153 family)
LERRSYTWFEKQRRTKALELSQEQIIQALDTVTLLHQTVQYVSEGKQQEVTQTIKRLFIVEREVDRLRREVSNELSKGAALFAEYREDLLHLVSRLDTLADRVKDAARCVQIISSSTFPQMFWEKAVSLTSLLVKCASILRSSLENVNVSPSAALKDAKLVEEVEEKIDDLYLTIKSLLIKHDEQINCGLLIIFHDFLEYIEQAADMCANTADYIITLAGRD